MLFRLGYTNGIAETPLYTLGLPSCDAIQNLPTLMQEHSADTGSDFPASQGHYPLGRVAYVIPGNIKTRDSDTPLPEFEVFVKRNGAVLLDKSQSAPQPGLTRHPLSRLLSDFELPGAVMRIHKKTPFDAIVASGEDVGLPLALLLRSRGFKVPLFIITHGSYFGSRKFHALMMLLRRQRNIHYLCLSDSLCHHLINRFGVPERQVHNAGYGVDLSFFEPRPDRLNAETPSDSLPIIASAGTANRDYRTLLNAVRGLSADVRIAADSAWFPAAVDITGQALPENVEARSYGNYTGLRQLYAQASFVIVPLYPAIHACGYAVVAEAMAMGKAVIATRTDSPPDFIVPGETGFYVPVGDAEALRERIRYLLERPDEALRMGQRAREQMAAQFSVEKYCERMESVIRACSI
jgi:glycosyltransferase involved in cell wall biosynthesis